MGNLLKIDCKRILKDKLFLVACIIGVAFAVFMPVLYFALFKATGLGEETAALLGMPINAKYIFSMSFSPGNNFALVVPVLITIALYKDFSFGTIRNKIIHGNSRTSVYLSMHVTNTIFLCGLLLAYALLSLGISLLFFEYQPSGFTMDDFVYLLQTILFECLIYAFIAALISFLCVFMKNAGTSVIMYIAINLVFTMIASILSVTASVLRMDAAKEKLVSVLDFFLKTNVFYAATTLGTGTSYTTEQILYAVLPSLVGIFVFVGLGILVFRKKDLK